MSDDNDPDYYQLRERQARELAAAATDPHVRQVHSEMADRYAELLAESARTRSDTPKA